MRDLISDPLGEFYSITKGSIEDVINHPSKFKKPTNYNSTFERQFENARYSFNVIFRYGNNNQVYSTNEVIPSLTLEESIRRHKSFLKAGKSKIFKKVLKEVLPSNRFSVEIAIEETNRKNTEMKFILGYQELR